MNDNPTCDRCREQSETPLTLIGATEAELTTIHLLVHTGPIEMCGVCNELTLIGRAVCRRCIHESVRVFRKAPESD